MNDPITFEVPPVEIYTSDEFGRYAKTYHTYSYYNYFRPGLISRIKRRRFNIALEMVSDQLRDSDVIDLGCADGPLLLTLAKHCKRVVGVDTNEEFLKVSRALVKAMKLDNVTLINNAEKSFGQLKADLPPGNYKVALLLETLEHVGRVEAMYESRVAFLNGLLPLLDDDGVIVISVPKMVGLGFLIKRMTQIGLRLKSEQFTFREMLAAGLLRKTDGFEHKWDGRHKGFNHLKLERAIRDEFEVTAHRETLITAFYVIRRKDRF